MVITYNIIYNLSRPVFLFLLTGLLVQYGQAQPRIRIWLELEAQNEHFGHLILTGLDPYLLGQLHNKALDGQNWNAIFPVYPGKRMHPTSSLPPMLGTHLVADDRVIFIPRFPFLEGTVYTAWLNLPLLHAFLDPGSDPGKLKLVNQVFEVPETTGLSPGKVDHIFPSGDTLPENLLKIYLHFNHPMREGVALKHIHLLDGDGHIVEEPFLVIEQELWDSNRKRLTLWFDPGRIKRHLVPHRKKGMPLKEGTHYTLKVDSTWEDAYGRKLGVEYRKQFVAGTSDRSCPDPNLWELELPAHHSHQGLVINFPEPLDHGLLQRSIQVFSEQGELVEGTVSIARDEKLWELLPEIPWQPGEYTIRIHTRLEDLAGNNLNRLFDTAPESRVTIEHKKNHYFIRFRILNH